MEQTYKSVEKMWVNYLTAIGEEIRNTNKNHTSWSFCDNEKSANNLVELVEEGIKTATTSLYYFYELDGEILPKERGFSIVTDWKGIAQCIIQTKKVTVVPFKEVTEEFAKKEGEGDKSLKYWRRVHIDFFTKELKEVRIEFSEEMLVVCEEFEVVYK